ncbi:phenylalanine 4-monooxygenase [Alteromonas lipolytica]|uniref:Phenylalanine-4-hydroxylase n=1 Tax=Alteromonas lipolytica TaxID=1856405 RepID=A0A1E8FIY3_9ALTE|nr:phenylalanine 4-monooxygenase [Alteromonas lipolytica]OFI35897.1 phenylalanine 4-monooxygenase [Alteromonas lipolytica]GGF72777.1 phenylalanine 4-monooxygenase [Alteromonas lipolytica]
MSKQSKYNSKHPDKNGIIKWTQAENAVWCELYQQQMALLPGRACDEYFTGVDMLGLAADAIPQLPAIDDVLMSATGWQTAAVPALISFAEFFELLANKRFPVATFIRSREEFHYLQEPDIFHEVMGHCPLLTNPAFAAFTETYGKLGLKASKEERVFLARLYWFTVEFGLVKQRGELRILGGGILSSPRETRYALESAAAVRHPLNVLDALRTPYRIDILQPLYYVLDSFDQLMDMANMDVMPLVDEARQLGLVEPLFTPKQQAS